jgi:Flp pilus assembly protein TadB
MSKGISKSSIRNFVIGIVAGVLTYFILDLMGINSIVLKFGIFIAVALVAFVVVKLLQKRNRKQD